MSGMAQAPIARTRCHTVAQWILTRLSSYLWRVCPLKILGEQFKRSVPLLCAWACTYCSSMFYSFPYSSYKSILYSIYKSFCKSILYSICKSILYSIYKPFCKSIFAIHKTMFGINKTIFGINKTIFRINNR